MQFLKPFQEETSKLAKIFLNHNPELMKAYVETSIHAIGYVLVPLNAFMKHLILVQDLDPNSDPEAKKGQRLLQEMNSLFDKVHEQEYEDDYDMSWALKRFEETRTRFKELQLTKEKFMDITNLTRVDCGVEMAPVATLQADHPGDIEMRGPFVVKADTDLDEGPDALDLLSEDLKKNQAEKERYTRRAEAIKKIRESLFKDGVGTNALADLKNALQIVVKAAKEVEEEEKEKKSGVRTSKKKLNKITRNPFKE
jgi:hypothetical protein